MLQTKSETKQLASLCVFGAALILTTHLCANCEIIFASNGARFLDVLVKGGDVALYGAGSAQEMWDEETQRGREGIDATMIKEPTAADLALLSEQAGYLYGPMLITWNQPTRSIEEWINSRTDIEPSKMRKRRDRWKNMRQKSEGKVSVETLPLTQANWELFYDVLYHPFVVSKKNANDAVSRTFYTRPGVINEESRFSLVLIRENGTNTPLAGVLLERLPELGILKTRCAAFNKTGEYEKWSLYTKTHEAAVEMAKAEGFPTLSYGSDPLPFSDEVGLFSFKVNLGYTPLIWRDGPPLLGRENFFGQTKVMKILNAEKLGLPLLTFSFFDRENPYALKLHVIGAEEGSDALQSLAIPPGVPVVYGR